MDAGTLRCARKEANFTFSHLCSTLRQVGYSCPQSCRSGPETEGVASDLRCKRIFLSILRVLKMHFRRETCETDKYRGDSVEIEDV